VPVGFGIWLAHYGFHLLTGVLTVVPVVQSAVIDALGAPFAGLPLWTWAGMRPGAVYSIEVGLVLLGCMGSMATVVGISRRDHPGRPGRASLPWLVVVAILGAASIWVLSQPMEMRATIL
jgi:hypothetical protein